MMACLLAGRNKKEYFDKKSWPNIALKVTVLG
jgi:hypothetical protein